VSASAATSSSDTKKKKKKTLGLITFDLDDTLYPIDPVIAEANAAFAKAMNNFGYDKIRPTDIDDTGKKIRAEIAKSDPKAAAILTHTEVRKLAIRREMEDVMLQRKLQETAEDWATEVQFLADIVVEHAKK
jgi:FMN phosphatase YigB (HAD superfamily)